ncbi:unnamed protein product [Calypogeia fissa]
MEPFLTDAGYTFSQIDGNMRPPARSRALKDFQVNPDVSIILLSLHAASTGLNIAFANHVMMLDNWWNPTVEDQAVDRTHRLGQTKEVHVHFFQLKGSIDTQVLSLQESKRKMVDNIMSFSSRRPKRGENNQDLDNIFRGMEREQGAKNHVHSFTSSEEDSDE